MNELVLKGIVYGVQLINTMLTMSHKGDLYRAVAAKAIEENRELIEDELELLSERAQSAIDEARAD